MKTTTHYNYEEVQKLSMPDTVLISINGGSTSMPALKDWKAVYEYRFDDVLPNGRSPRYLGKKPRITDGYQAMDEEDAQALAYVIKCHWDDSIHVQCAAGVSRSAAVAKVLHELGWEYVCPTSRPRGYEYANQHVVSLLKQQFPETFSLIGQV